MSFQTATERSGLSRTSNQGGTEGTEPVVFQPTEDGLAVIDIVERYLYRLSTSTGVTPTVVDPETFAYPVDAAVRIRTDHVAVHGDVPTIYVRDGGWDMLAETNPPTDRTFPAGEYYLEICAPIKLFLHVDGPLTVTATTDGKRVQFDGERAVDVGAFSKHERPAASVTTTGAPRDVMTAISTFGSALKTTSPERSFPNQRGHPPAVELGDELSVPGDLAPPDTGVTIEVPPEFRYVYPVATLAYYFGAEVVPGESPRLVTDAGLDHDLAPAGRFQRELERVLKGTFLLDCITRTEGLYDVTLDERQAVEPAVDLDFAALYGRSLAERLDAYLDVPYETLAPHVPDWKLTADVATDVDAVETLPFVVNDLAVIRTNTGTETESDPVVGDPDSDRQAEAIDSFLRSSRSVVATPTYPTSDLPAAPSMEHTWVGQGVSHGASKAMAAAYRNRLERTRSTGDIGVTVVCNDPAMNEEQAIVDTVYNSREMSPVDASITRQLSTDELRRVLADESEFFHYIGHIDERGFECTDGWLDASTLESTGVDVFLLNACSSYDQGKALIEAGAIGGIVTLAEVINESAVRIGSTVARLLDNGYPLRPALDIARTTSYCGGDYIVVGDGSVAAVNSRKFIPNVHKVWRDGDEFVLEIVSYSIVLGGMGDIFTPYLEGVDRYYLSSGSVDTFRLREAELEEFLQLDDNPIVVGEDLYWPDEFELSEV